MVLDYYPMDVNRTYEFIWDVAGYNDNISVQETIEDLLDDRFCRHIFPKGKNKGQMCMKHFRKTKDINNQNKYCYEHKYLHIKCNIKNCYKNRKKGEKVCFKHFKIKTKIETLDEYHSYNDYNEYIYNYRNYKDYINKIKIRNDFSWPKNYFDNKNIEIYKSNPMIKYEKFSLLDFLNCIYDKYKIDIYNFTNKYKISIKVLYYLIYLIKEINKKQVIKDIILYKNSHINIVFFKNIYLYIEKIKYDNFCKYLYKIYNTNYINLFKTFLKSDNNNMILLRNNINIFKKYKKINGSRCANLEFKSDYDYVKDIVKIEYNILNSHYYTCINISTIKIKDVEINRPTIPKLICYTSLTLNSEERKQKKRLQKFNIKYNKLLKINEEVINFIDNKLKTLRYKKRIKEIIYENMYFLDKRIKNENKDINIIRDTYRQIYSELCNTWYGFYPDDEEKDEYYDDKIVNDISTWKKYASHEDDNYKRFIKI